jgi:Tol biopolymer transport system component
MEGSDPRRHRALLVGFLAAFSALVAGAADADDVDVVRIISSASDGAPAQYLNPNGRVSRDIAWSPDGSMVAFRSDATNLTADSPPSGRFQVYIKDLAGGGTTLVSRDDSGAPVPGEAGAPQWSPDGVNLMFMTAGGRVLIRNVATGDVTPLETASGEAVEVCCGEPVWSPDGSQFAFASLDNDLPGHHPSYANVYTVDLASQTFTLVSEPDTPVQAELGVNGSSELPEWSPNGRYIAFQSTASNLVAGADVPGFQRQIYLYDVAAERLRVASRAGGGPVANGQTYGTSIAYQGPDHAVHERRVWSPDGNSLLFVSDATNLVSRDTGGKPQLYTKDIVSGNVTLVSASATGTPGDDYSGDGQWSPDGTRVLFDSGARNLGAPTGGTFVKTLADGSLAIIDADTGTGCGCGTGTSWSPDGQWISFIADRSFSAMRVATGGMLAVSPLNGDGGRLNILSSRPVWSPDGSRLAFELANSDLLPGVSGDQIYLWTAPRRSGGPGAPGTGPNEGDVSTVPAPPPDGNFSYVALGDSYSSGEGVDPYFRDGYDPTTRSRPGTVDNRCHRSSRAYAESITVPGVGPIYQLASGGGNPGSGDQAYKYGSDRNVRTRGAVTWAFWACAGAKTENLRHLPWGGATQYDEPLTQIDAASLNDGTDLITLTIGGNDVGFVDVLVHCSRHACTSSAYRAELASRVKSLRIVLDTTFPGIRDAAKHADVLVVGYPRLFPDGSQQTCPKLTPWRGEMHMLREMGDKLNDALHDAALRWGFRFVDVARLFSGHEVCGADGEWLNGPSTTWRLVAPGREGPVDVNLLDDESFHPNLDGQAAYAAAVNSALFRPASRARSTITGPKSVRARVDRRGRLTVPLLATCGVGPCAVSALARTTARPIAATAGMQRTPRARAILGSAAIALASGQRARAKLRLNRGSRRLLRRRGSLRSKITLVVRDGHGAKRSGTTTVRLARARR